jgi:histidyl-tRNA synthetase
MDFGDRSFRAQLRAANRSEAPYALVLGDDELTNQQITLQDMLAGERQPVPLDQAVATLKQRLESTVS